METRMRSAGRPGHQDEEASSPEKINNVPVGSRAQESGSAAAVAEPSLVALLWRPTASRASFAFADLPALNSNSFLASPPLSVA